MGSNNIYRDHLEEILLQDSRFRDENDEIDGRAVKIYAQKLDEKLIGYLLEDDKSREKFFLKINDTYVFKANDFNFFLEQNKLNNSFTKYANQIGLTLDGKYLKDTSDVVLDFPYKDCVLEGGQSTEEGKDTFFEFDEEVTKTQKKKGYAPNEYNEKQTAREEIFYNNIIAKDEIDRLEEPKAFENIVKYTEKGEENFEKFNRNDKGVITDNLLIKGNNLLSLHSLKEEFKDKVKLIYIDPPFNIGTDDFDYNDNFNHSTWLTFIKNRLEIARQLLRDDGAIFIHIDHHELAYLNILMDEVFNRDNFVQLISVKSSSPAGFKTVNPGPIDVTEYILFYTKNRTNFEFEKGYVPVGYDSNYNLFIENYEDGPENWELIPLRNVIYRMSDIEVEDSPQSSAKNAEEKWGPYWKIIREQIMSKFAIENAEKVVSVRDPQKPSSDIKELQKKSLDNKGQVYVYSRDLNDAYIYNGGMLSFYSKKVREIEGELTSTELLTDLWDDISWDGIANEGSVTLKNGKKPERLLQRIIELATEEGEVVLDFFLGSGTTAAVAHKMNRQYIGIEQLDYGENGSVTRLQNVIGGDDSGISKYVEWEGGGSFVYLEMAKNNEKAKRAIEQCESLDQLTSLFEELYEKYFLHYNVKIKEFKEEIIKEKQFKKLSLDRQKEMFCRMLDNNQMYVNRDEMEDTHFNLAEEDIALTKDFYKIEE